MLGWIRRVFQKFASQPGDSVEHQEGQERETRLQKVLFWSPYATMAPEPYPPPTLLEHSADPPFLSWPLFLCRSACLLLLLCCCSFHTTPGACWVSLLWDFLCCSGFLRAPLLVSHPDFQIPGPMRSILSSYLLSHPCHSVDPGYDSGHLLLPHIALTTFLT